MAVSRSSDALAAGRSGGRLLLVAALFTLINNYLPGGEHLDIAVLNALAVTGIALGALSQVVPWQRLPSRSTLVLALLAFTLLALGDLFGDVSAYSYAVYYVVVFVWVGIAQPPGTSYWLAPFGAVAYVTPFLMMDTAPATALGSTTVAIPVCVLVGEVLARAMSRLVRQREHELAVVDVLPDGVLVLGPDGRVRSANERAAVLLGTPRALLTGTVPDLPVGAVGTALPAELAGRRLEVVATVLPDSDERVVMLRDVSRQHALDQAKDLFLATTSHELRTPLTAIKGYLHVLQRRWDVLDDTRRREAVATMAERTDVLVTLTDHLLLGARAGASRYSTPSRPFDLGVALGECARAFEGDPAHRLRLELPDPALQVLGDLSGLRQILAQLLANAAKYSPHGGTVIVTATRQGGFAQVTVADEGIGLPAGDSEQLFSPFFQGGPTNTREFGGVGLGLYIVRELVRAQGGVVSAENRPGAGSVLTFTLPLAAGPPLPRAGREIRRLASSE